MVGMGTAPAGRLLLAVGLAFVVGALALLLAGERAMGAAVLPDGFGGRQVVSGLNRPTAMAFAPDGRLFVTEQGGAVRVVKYGRLLPTPFLRVNTDNRGERGLLGIAFAPGFGVSNNHVYVYYTAKTPRIHNRISRFTATGDVAAAGSQRAIFDLDNLGTATNHNGGAIHFGRDGMLYVAVGDAAQKERAQRVDNPFGKILRITADGGIPKDNPYYRNSSVRGKDKVIWARGLRNPYSFAVQPGTGQIFINDVGQQKWEEIDRGAKRANYGWPVYEGRENDRRFTSPLYAYAHGDGPATGCAITGGAFYNPPVANFPARYTGDYFFADFCSGWIRFRDASTGGVDAFASNLQNPVDLQTGPDGALYVLERGTGSVTAITAGVAK